MQFFVVHNSFMRHTVHRRNYEHYFVFNNTFLYNYNYDKKQII